MIARRIAVILLAAGRATRFGGGKLGADLCGRPVARHASDRLAALPATMRIAVCSAHTPDLPGYRRLTLEPAGAPLSRSIATGIAALNAMPGGADAVLFALADMPLVPAGHFTRLVENFDGDRIATRSEGRNMVPAIFGAMHFAALSALEGDRGAGALLRDAPAIELASACALDIDTREDIEQARILIQATPALP